MISAQIFSCILLVFSIKTDNADKIRSHARLRLGRGISEMPERPIHDDNAQVHLSADFHEVRYARNDGGIL